MSLLWTIIRSEVEDDPDYPDSLIPTICGIFNTKEEAVEEIIKLYIEDDIDLLIENPKTNKTEDYRPKPEIAKLQRKFLLKEGYTTYTNRGNLYTLVPCALGVKHDFAKDVMDMYNKSK